VEKKLKKIEETNLFRNLLKDCLDYNPLSDEGSLTKKFEHVKEICLKHSQYGDPETEVKKTSFKTLI